MKSSCLHMSLYRHNSSAECAGELFKPTNDSASLQVYNDFSEILPSNGLGLGPGEVDQGGLKVLYL